METDISPIFGNTDTATTATIVSDHSTNEEDTSPLEDVIEPRPPPPLEQEYSQQQFYSPQQQPAFMYPSPPSPPQWDPFSSVGATAWVVMALAFIIGFVIGKLR